MESKDNNFTWKDFQARNNSELVAILGNFVNRAMVLDHKYFEGKVPACGELQAIDEEAIREIKESVARLSENFDNFKFREARYEADLFPYKHRRILIGEGDAAQDRAFLHAVFNEELEQFLRFLHFGAFQNFSHTDVNFVEVFVAAGLLDEDPSVLVGKEICFIANFEPRKMMGIESQGMILSAVNSDGNLVVVGPTGPVAPGACVG